MDEDGLPIVGSGIDLTKVPAIQQRRIVAFLNQFIVHTVRFLNRFSTVCEEKLASISLRIQQIETTLSILEAKATREVQRVPLELKAEALVENVMTVAKDPRYARYLKMVQVGVPVMAIKNKMVLEGLDPSLLDTPDAPVPDGVKKGADEQDDDSSGSESSFSD
ncbi:WASH complex subunit 3-like isoform X2 [Myxocyprinus asiaticus]|uniref:WASH complex subunit 3-like isoform X2 n=1 Tax=Myxocyprinus asiaticus TaxID=70543 RepID=UPI002223DD36|nr:WASH complex subunit 3-like isoform X2 [Myxocyprinus asiaticus]